MLSLTYMILQNKIISHLQQANYCENGAWDSVVVKALRY